MDLNTWGGILFVVFLALYLVHQRHRLQISGLFPALYFAMFRTTLGLKAMDWVGKKHSDFFKKTAPLVIGLGFVGMALITFELIRGLYMLVTLPEAPAGVGIVQPFFKGAPGTVFVPFLYFIISIFVIATIHEFSHGVLARAWNIKVKSSGFAFLGIGLPVIPAAFVEPEEKTLRARPAIQQLSVFAAGPMANVFLALIVLFLMVMTIPAMSEAMFTQEGVEVSSYINGNVTYPAENSNLELGEIITHIDDERVYNYSTFNATLHEYLPGDTVNVTTDKTVHTITLAKRDDRKNGFLGVNVKPYLKNKPEFVATYGPLVPEFAKWSFGLMTWLFILNLGIGLFNLVPIGPIDGGRMLQTALRCFFHEAKADRIWKNTSTFVLAVLAFNVLLAIFK
ncbi:MAG: site-2 protease family protein [Candidatus Nanoarchaeia archaeon]